MHPYLYGALKLTFPMNIGWVLSQDGPIKTEMGQAVGVLTPDMVVS